MGSLPGLLLGAHGGVVLLEALGKALRHGHLLLDAARDAALLARRQRLGREVVDARDEAVVDEVAEELLAGPPPRRQGAGCVSQTSFLSLPRARRPHVVLGRRPTPRAGGGRKKLTPINSFIWRFCRRCSSSRCSELFSLPGEEVVSGRSRDQDELAAACTYPMPSMIAGFFSSFRLALGVGVGRGRGKEREVGSGRSFGECEGGGEKLVSGGRYDAN